MEILCKDDTCALFGRGCPVPGKVLGTYSGEVPKHAPKGGEDCPHRKAKEVPAEPPVKEGFKGKLGL